MRLDVRTDIVEVTVYPAAARVTRRGRASIPEAGPHELAVAGLPLATAEDSVRAGARGQGLALTGVDLAAGGPPAGGRLAELREEVERLEDQGQELADRDEAVDEDLARLEALREASARSLGRALARAEDGAERADAVAAELAARADAARARRRGLAGERRGHERALAAARAALERAEQFARAGSRTAVAGIEATAAGEVELTVSYLVYAAGWGPLYDARLAEDRVELTFLAAVRNTSAEDWPAVPLLLSTAEPGVARALPDPPPWYVSFTAPTPRFAAMQVASGPVPPPSYAPRSLAAAAAPAPPIQAPEAEFLEAEVEESGPARSYRAARPLAVPADGQPHRVPLARLDLDAEVDRVCAPRRDPTVHLRARVKNESALTLLPGAVAIFHGEELAGRGELELVAPGEEIELHLGTDSRVRVERELVRREAERAGLVGGGGRTRLAYETRVANHRDEPIVLVLLDQVPVARDPQITVKIERAEPRPAESDELGRLEWRLELAAGAETAVNVAFAVEAPRDRPVFGLGA